MPSAHVRLLFVAMSATVLAASCTESGPDSNAADLSKIDRMLVSLGADSVDATRACVLDTASAEGLTALDLTTGTGGAVYVAALRCDDAIVSEMIASASRFDTAGTDLTTDDVDCVQRASVDYFATLPLAESEDILSAPEPPDDMLAIVIGSCDVSRDDALLVMG